jgi:putative transposase
LPLIAEHLRSAIQFVTPAQRHTGEDIEVLAKRKRVYEQAKLEKPERWSGEIRNWKPAAEVYLNPEKKNRVMWKKRRHKF